MSPSKYITIASSRLKEYVSQHRDDLGGPSSTQSWKQWAGTKIKRGRDAVLPRNEEISVFPGWAVRRYDGPAVAGNPKEPLRFAVHVFVSGYASWRRSPELVTRSQRGFMKLAKSFASLPKLPSDPDSRSASPIPLTLSTENLLASVKLPPRPTEISEDYEIQVLEQQFRQLNAQESDSPELPAAAFSSPSTNPYYASSITSLSLPGQSVPPDVRRLHANLESRIRLFWSTAIAARIIRIHLFAAASNETEEKESHNPPLASMDVQTDANGYFSTTFTVPWDEICCHPCAVRMATSHFAEEHDIWVVAEMLPAPLLTPAVPSEYSDSRSVPYFSPNPHLSPTSSSAVVIPLTHSPLRVVSDIDDTIKFSDITGGARAAFKNVFVKDLHETIIPGMGEWYSEMWRRGVRFHYVSNGPFELLPLVSEFLQVSNLPPGSIKLKSYAGRTLFNGLLSAPATRKRAGVLDLLESFPSSQFILIGDSGEQDLELYASLASERPGQIVAIFVRDVNVGDGTNAGDALATVVNGIDDPTGLLALTNADLVWSVKGSPVLPGGGGFVSEPEADTPSPPISPVKTSSSSSMSSSSIPPLSSMSPKMSRTLSDLERRRNELQIRVWKARTLVPSHIPLRVFRQPEECVEANGVLERICG